MCSEPGFGLVTLPVESSFGTGRGQTSGSHPGRAGGYLNELTYNDDYSPTAARCVFQPS